MFLQGVLQVRRETRSFRYWDAMLCGVIGLNVSFRTDREKDTLTKFYFLSNSLDVAHMCEFK